MSELAGRTSPSSPFDGIERGVSEVAGAARDLAALSVGLGHEGVSGLFDPAGLLDRSRARRELADSFVVLPDTDGTVQTAAHEAARHLDAATTRRGTDEAAIVRTLQNRGPEERARILAAYEARTGETLDETIHRPGSGLPRGNPALLGGFSEQHNVLTKEQYERVVGLYSDIRLGRTDIVAPSGTVLPAFMEDIETILQTESGRGLVGALAEQPSDHRTVISPLPPEEDASDAITTMSGAMFGSDHRPRGDASQTTVEYHPGEAADLGTREAWSKDFRSDRILYHELVHAYHNNTWTDDRRHMERANGALPKDSIPTKREMTEYQSVGLGEYRTNRFSENRYAQERRRIGMTDRGERTGDDRQLDRDSYHGTRRVSGPFEHYAD
jgi:Effector protein/Annexin